MTSFFKMGIKNPSIFNDRRINLFIDKMLMLLCIKCILYGLIIPIVIPIVSFVNHGCVCSNISYSFGALRPINPSCFIQNNYFNASFYGFVTFKLNKTTIINTVSFCTTVCITVVASTPSATSCRPYESLMMI